MRGRKPRPTVLKLARGEEERRINRQEPKSRALGRAPLGLSDEAREHWRTMAKRLGELGVALESDTEALAVHCETWAMWRRASREVEAGGAVDCTTRGDLRVSPWMTLQVKLAEQLYRQLIEFGATPSSRGRIKVQVPEVDPLTEFLASQRRKKAE